MTDYTEETVQVTFAILQVLAKREGGRGTLDELLRDVRDLGDQETLSRSSDLDSIDVLEAGLVVKENGELRITEAGRSVLRALDALASPSSNMPPLERLQSAHLVDGLIDEEMRRKIFDLELREPGVPPQEEQDPEPDEAPPDRAIEPADQSETSEIVDAPADPRRKEPRVADFSLSAGPPPLPHDIGRLERPVRTALPQPVRSSPKSGNLKRFAGILRGHIEHEAPNVKPDSKGGGTSGLLVTVLVLLVVIICAGTVIAVTQIKSLTSEITTLEKKLVPLKKQVADLEQEEKGNSSRQNTPVLATAGKSNLKAESPPPPLPLLLSPEEVGLVREYIRPAPYNGPAVTPVKAGDPVTVATIPLPPSLMDKVPKLLGARFTVRNGAIIIVKRNSRQADAVIGPN